MKIIIFCGGFGTRMWPASHKSYPKQFYPLLNGKSFFQNTVDRFKKKFSPNDIFVSTEEKYVDFIKKQAPDIPVENIIGEPERRDNLGAIGLVTALIEKRHSGEVIFFSWSDHIIEKEDEFLAAVQTAGDYTKSSGRPVSIDQKPTFATIHNGWLELGKEIDIQGKYKIVEIIKHLEKPDQETANKLFASPNYLIHTGYGAWRSDVLLDYYKKYAPDIFSGLVKIMSDWDGPNKESTLRCEYSKFEKVSVDYGLFEKIPSTERATIPVDMGWKDVGTWQLFYESLTKDENGNLVEGGIDTELIDVKNSLIFGPSGKIVAVIGLSNIAIIETEHGLLVANLDKTNQVKEIFASLEKNKPKYVE